MGGEQPRTQRVPHPTDLTVVVPEDWWRIDLSSAEEATLAVDRLVQRQFRGIDDQPVLRRQARAELVEAARQAAGSGGLMMWVSHQLVAGYPLSASLVVSEMPTAGPDGIAGLAERLQDMGEVDTARAPAGPVLRRRTKGDAAASERLGAPEPSLLVDYWLEAPDRSVLLLAFSTPLAPFGDAMVELFDAVVTSVRFGSTA